MERYFNRSISHKHLLPAPESKECNPSISKKSRVDVDLADLPADPGLRTRILDYDPNIRDQVRRSYLQKGPCQPHNHQFPQTKIGNYCRRFNSNWFVEYPDWLEYSIEKDAAFCLYCYLFKIENREQGGGDSFVIEGFKNWKKKDRFSTHVGGPSSFHNQARKMAENLLNAKQHIIPQLSKQTDQVLYDYRVRLNSSIDCIRFLLRQGLAFRGHDESEDSTNRGNFLELLQFLANHNDDIKNVVLRNAPENDKLTSPEIQKDIVNACAIETANAIIGELDASLFSILIDESRDVSTKEQMAVALRYVNNMGHVVERFIGIVHVKETSASSLKKGIEALFSKHGLSISRLRGQGYDGASNMRDEFNGLKSLILNENKCAFYIHCFAHQLQLALVATAKNHIQIASLFSLVSNISNVVKASCKRCDTLREKQASDLIVALEKGELSSGRGLNQECSLKRPGDTRWSSHFCGLLSLIKMFHSVIEVLEIVEEDGANSKQRAEAYALLESMQSFDFIFGLHLMKNVLGITHELSQALQRKDQDIVNAMELVSISKKRMQMMRDDGWDNLLFEVSTFCMKQKINVPKMDEKLVARGRSRRKAIECTNLQYYRVGFFLTVIDMQVQELNNRFPEANTDLLLGVACLSPNDTFSFFNKEKLIRLAQFYPNEFSDIELLELDNQLDTFILDMRSNEEFSELNGMVGLAERIVMTKKDKVYPLVYLLLKLALILPVATATVERAFSAMNIIKSRLRNRMGDQWMNDNLITFIEKDIFDTIGNDVIIKRFQNMKTRRYVL